MRKKIYILFLIIVFSVNINAQDSSEVEIFIIDSYVTPEIPHTFNLSFYTSEPVKAKIIIDEKYKFDISKNYKEDHTAAIDFSKFSFKKKNIKYVLIVENKKGQITKSEVNEIVLPYDEFIETKEGNNPVTTLTKGILLYLLPSPNLVILDGKNYFGITKEFSIITFYSSGYNYPSGNISLEYSHVYNAPIKDFLRIGYKHFFTVKGIEFVSTGVSAFTNFKGFNGVSPEITLGLFKFYNVFTFYTRYRYNVKPANTAEQFHEISIGLYSNFFTIDL